MSEVDPWALLRERIDSQFAAMNQRIDDRAADTNRRIDDVAEALYGNGQPGLIRLVDRHEQQLKAQRTGDHSAASRHGGLWGGVTGLVAAIVTGVLIAFGQPNR
jgi:hypothetical protein